VVPSLDKKLELNELISIGADKFYYANGFRPTKVHLTGEQIDVLLKELEFQVRARYPNNTIMKFSGMEIIMCEAEGPHYSGVCK